MHYLYLLILSVILFWISTGAIEVQRENAVILVPQVVLKVYIKSYNPLKEIPKPSCSEAESSDKFQGLFPVSGPH